MQVKQDSRRNPRAPERHRRADAGVEHPCRQGSYDAWLYLHMNNAAASAPFAVMGSYTSAVEGMPAIVNFNLLPDMGRMTA